MATVQPSVKDTLSATESSNNPNAWRRNKDGREFVGQWQFGEARLRDLGLGVTFTMDQFRLDPELQSRIMDMHIEDINNFIEKNGLNAYEGTTVGGIPITRSGMIAMAHLGGSGGMKRFLETDGEYNPSDELGTSLTDYAVKHGGPLIANTQEAKESRLRSFAASADDRALQYQSMAERISTMGFDAAMNTRQPPAGPMMALAQVDPKMRAFDGVMPPATQLGFGSAVPAGADPFTAQGMPKPIRMGAGELSFGGNQEVATPTGAPPGFGINPQDTAGMSVGETVSRGNPVASTQEAATEGDPEKTGFLTQLGRMIFGEEEEDPSGRLKTMIGGIGVGLGQMSAGMPVDLQPYFANVAAQRQALIEGEQAARQAEMQQQLDFMEAETARINAETAWAKFQNELQTTGVVPPFSQEQLQEFAENPATRMFVAGLSNPDDTIRREAYKGITDYIGSQLDGDGSKSPEFASAYGVFTNPNSTDAEKMEALAQVPTDLLSEFANMPGIKPPGEVAVVNEYLNAVNAGDMDRAAALMDFAVASGGGQTSPQLLERQANFTAGQAYRTKLSNAAASGNKMTGVLDQIIRLSDNLISKEVESSLLNNLKADAVSYFSGLQTDKQNRFEELIGIDRDAWLQLDGATQRLTIMAAAPMLEGTGTISDSERTAIARALAQPGLSNEARIEFAAQLKALNEMDRLAFNYYEDNRGEGFVNHSRTQRSIINNIEPLGEAIANAWKIDAGLTRARSGKTNETANRFREKYAGRDMADIIAEVAPTLSREQFEIIKDQLPDNFDKVFQDSRDGIFYHVNSAGEIVPVDMEAMAEKVLIPLDQEN